MSRSGLEREIFILNCVNSESPSRTFKVELHWFLSGSRTVYSGCISCWLSLTFTPTIPVPLVSHIISMFNVQGQCSSSV